MGNLVITICREYCSGGKSVGMKLAEKLGIKCYDKELIAMAAKETGYSEDAFNEVDEIAANSLLYSLAMGYGFGTKEVMVPNNDKLFAVQSDIIRDLAKNESCVIVGRCSDYVLRDEERIVKVFIRCDMEEREKRLEELGIDTKGKSSESVLHKMDKKRSSYHKFYTGQAWDVINNYDLVINTAKIGIDGAVEQILNYINNYK
ncbi:MAG: AAA family ATPase [Lachnospirales bacterium]